MRPPGRCQHSTCVAVLSDCPRQLHCAVLGEGLEVAPRPLKAPVDARCREAGRVGESGWEAGE